LISAATELSVRADSVDEKSAMAVKLCCRRTDVVRSDWLRTGVTSCKEQVYPRGKNTTEAK
jgi:hypothetical protein